MIADTSFLIDLMKKKEEAVTKLEEIEKNKESQCTTTSSIFELATGIAKRYSIPIFSIVAPVKFNGRSGYSTYFLPCFPSSFDAILR
ncbi:MAG: hypothetical protein HeimC3_32610 [Candidatus Heimdallarchaeota archaeon LC_3]|nr:MAG: hypothetical protein HeimC3_32610 [Candidatus Heimdallarchaeota archaeon LC_3]